MDIEISESDIRGIAEKYCECSPEEREKLVKEGKIYVELVNNLRRTFDTSQEEEIRPYVVGFALAKVFRDFFTSGLETAEERQSQLLANEILKSVAVVVGMVKGEIETGPEGRLVVNEPFGDV